MSLTNKLFSLLGFAEPVALKRFNGNNLFPNKALLLNIAKQVNSELSQVLAQLPFDVIDNSDELEPKTITALIIDATQYIDESSYHTLFIKVQASLQLLANNARILVIANASSEQQSSEQNAFSQALVGFTKSLAKEVGRKGSTANIALVDKSNINDEISAAFVSPIRFFLSAASAFVSGQVLTINNNAKIKNHSLNNTAKQKRQPVALVTGAAQGIGAAIASKLAGDGYLVIGVDIESMKDALINSMKRISAGSYIVDVSATDAGEKLANLAQQYQGFDLIVHNAGITRDKTLAKMPEHFWQQTLDINLLAVMRINNTLINENCINHGGSIVCLSSMNGMAGQGGQTNYACSKAGIIGYVHSMSNQLSAKNISINAVAPGFIETKMTAQIPFFTREMGRRMSALGQGGLPVDVAETVAFLGDSTSYGVSGQTLRVCGLNLIGA